MYIVYSSSLFLAVQDSSIGDLVSESVSDFSVFRALQSWLTAARMTSLPGDQKDEKIWYDQHEDKDKDKGSDLVI